MFEDNQYVAAIVEQPNVLGTPIFPVDALIVVCHDTVDLILCE
jgi:hypothetical protein